MATKKISAMTDGVTANATDTIPMVRSGLNKYITPAYIQTYILGNIGLLARYHNSSNLTMTTGATVINFNTSDYDPLSLVTTGVSWVFTAPATGWYKAEIENFFVDPNGSGWSADDSVQVTPYKNGSLLTGAPDLAYWDAGDAIATINKYPFLTGSITCSLTAGDTLALKFNNSATSTRKVDQQAAITISRAH